MSGSGLSLNDMVFDPSEIVTIYLGSEDYPEGFASKKGDFWQLELVQLDEDENFTGEYKKFEVKGGLLELFENFPNNYFQIESNQDWESFKEYVKPLGRIYWDLLGSFNGVDFEELEFPDSSVDEIILRPRKRIKYQQKKKKRSGLKELSLIKFFRKKF